MKPKPTLDELLRLAESVLVWDFRRECDRDYPTLFEDYPDETETNPVQFVDCDPSSFTGNVETAEIILSHYKITRKRLTCEEIEHSFEIFFMDSKKHLFADYHGDSRIKEFYERIRSSTS